MGPRPFRRLARRCAGSCKRWTCRRASGGQFGSDSHHGLWRTLAQVAGYIACSWWAIAHLGHLPACGLHLSSFLSSTWGRADQQASHDSHESGAFCFVLSPHTWWIFRYAFHNRNAELISKAWSLHKQCRSPLTHPIKDRLHVEVSATAVAAIRLIESKAAAVYCSGWRTSPSISRH
jgi:hypothetical protein